ncbi:MAG: hypothetical protein CMJ81_15310 [Planctomycetaceae bacterium]|nr:hypothetical protein [Planctomycetaceae bacterium]MBP62764.1 hypothetical protein [Planctomycetaceae bacterium]
MRPENRGEAANANHQDNTIQPEKNENTIEVHKVCAQQVDCQFEMIVFQEKMTLQRTVEPPTGMASDFVTELSDWPILLQNTNDEVTLSGVISDSELIVRAVGAQSHPAEYANQSKLSGRETLHRTIDAAPNNAKGTGTMGDQRFVEVRFDSGANGAPAPASNEVLITSSHAEVDAVLEEMDLSSFAHREVVGFNMGQLLDAVPDGVTQELGPPGMKSDAVNTRHGIESPRVQCRNHNVDANTTGTQQDMETSSSLQQAGRQQMVETGDEITLAGELLDLVSFLPGHDLPLFEPPRLEGFEIPLESHEVRQPIPHDQVALEDHQLLTSNLPDVPETKMSASESLRREQKPQQFVVDVCPQKQASVLPFNSNRSPGERLMAQQPLLETVEENLGSANDRRQPNIEEEDPAESNGGNVLSANVAFEEGEVTGNQTVEPGWECSPDATDTVRLNGGSQKNEPEPMMSRGERQVDSSAAEPRGMNDSPAVHEELPGAVLSHQSRENDGVEIPDGNAVTSSTKVQETENPLPALKDAVAELLRFSIPLLAPASMSPAVSPTAPHKEERRLAELNGTQVGQRYQELADHLYGSLPFKSGSSISFLGIESTADTTEVVTNAGLLLAQEPSERVLLIDGDFSEKRLTRQFSLQGSKGLAEVLNDERTCGDVVHPCETPNLSVVPAGTGLFPRQPSAVRRLPSIIDELKRQFSIILFDAGGAEDSQVETLVRWTDASYLVLPLGAHTVEDLDGVISLLQRCAARMMGCILTNVTVETVS